MDQKRIVILEDDIVVRAIVEAAVSADGYLYRSCGSVREMREAEDGARGDFYLIDINLPDGSGLDIVKTIRSEQSRAGIIVLSGSHDEFDKVLGLELGADDYITKPFRPRELRARIRAVGRRIAMVPDEKDAAPPKGASADLEIMGLRINRQARRVLDPRGMEIRLTTLEYDVLVALVTPPNTVLSREQIMDRVRGPDWSSYDRAIDGVVSRLRGKLEAAGVTQGVIKTVRNVGYMVSVTA